MMKNSKNIYSLLLAGMILIAIVSCQPKNGMTVEESDRQKDQTALSGWTFDPLELAVDSIIAADAAPQNEAIVGIATSSGGAANSMGGSDVEGLPDSIDSLNSQAYRVQIFSTKVYGDARNAVRIAEEIFDRPVSLDYEVPYFKVRVGSFKTREKAEDYKQRAKSAGYENAWVVMVTVNVHETAPLYPADSVQTVIDTTSENGNDD